MVLGEIILFMLRVSLREQTYTKIILKTRRKHIYIEYWFEQYFFFQLLYAIKTVNLLIKILIFH